MFLQWSCRCESLKAPILPLYECVGGWQVHAFVIEYQRLTQQDALKHIRLRITIRSLWQTWIVSDWSQNGDNCSATLLIFAWIPQCE